MWFGRLLWLYRTLKKPLSTALFVLKLRGKLLTCQALDKSVEPNTLAVRIDFDQRPKLLAADPSVCYVTDHYMNYPTVLVRLSRIDRKSLTDLLGSAWGFVSSGTKASVREQKAKRKSR
jgi:hypothetical protein